MLRRAVFWLLLWIVWLTVLTILSSMSHPGPRPDVAGFDKIVHFTYFLMGGCLLTAALLCRARGTGAPVRWAVLTFTVLLIGATVGGLDEWHQNFTPGRHGLDVFDWLADLLGSLAAAPLVRVLLRARASARSTADPL